APSGDTEAPSGDTEAPSGDTEAPSGDTEAPDGTEAPEVDPESIEFDVGVDEETIRVGMLADLSGAFAPLVTEIVEAQRVYWDKVNEEGGIAGRQIELVIEDNAYDVPTHLEKYEAIRDEVAIISQSTGSPHTSAIADNLVEDDLIAIPLTWYSGWADPEFGQNVFETYTSYCIESMNAIEWFATNRDVETVAIVSFPGEYGGDGAAGARMAAEELGLEIVYDGTDQVIAPTAENASPDQSAVISQIVESDPDLVWSAINPATLGSIMSGAVGQGFDGLWSGNSPSYSFKLLATELAPLLDEFYIASTYIVTWGADVPGMDEVVTAMEEGAPDLPVSDVYVLGWTEAQVTQAILEEAAANGDMTRAGIVAAANEVEVSFDGLAPDQSWVGEPNDYIVRESYIYDVVLDQYQEASLGEGGGSTGWELLEGPYVSDLAAEFQYEGPCFEPTG
ncbi:MAG: ABC transporter substrate-binding protein, partial [Actinomycetota bacterium]|nr:ABC transporter substrate-binding protein [Actinomycetota bacterium]